MQAQNDQTIAPQTPAPPLPAASQWLRAAILIAICAALYLPGFFGIPAVDRDESRFAQASRQMLESGDIVVPMVLGTPRLNKPPLIYWAQSAAAWGLTGGDSSRDRIWMYRLPSLFAAIGIVILTWRIGRTMMEEPHAMIAAAALAASPLMFWEARQARADMVLIFFITAAMAALWKVVRVSPRSPGWGVLTLFWLAVGLGVMTKGPVPLMVAGGALLMMCAATSQWRLLMRINPIFGVVVILGVGLPWLIAVVNRIGASSYWHTVFGETVGRSMQAKEGHWGPPGYYLALAPVFLFPVSIGIGAGVVAAVRAVREAWASRREEKQQPISPDLFLIAWIVPAWVIFEAISTKLPHYTMPMFPAAAILCVRGLTSRQPWAIRLLEAAWVRRVMAFWIVATLVVSLTAFLIAAAAMDDLRGLSLFGAMLAFAGAASTIAGGLAMFRLMKNRQFAWMLAAATAVFGLAAASLGGSMPGMSRIWTSRQIGEVLAKVDPSGVRPVAAVGYEEDSLIFETHGRAERIKPSDLNKWLERHPNGIVCIDDDPSRAFPELVTIRAVSGFNYSKGRWANVVVAQLVPPY